VFFGSGRGSRSRLGATDFRLGYEGQGRGGRILRGIFFGDDGRAQRSVA
jgi:hypothetical protein